MHPPAIEADRGAWGLIHRFPPTAKLLGAVGIVATVALLPRAPWAPYGGIALGLLLLAAGSGLRWGTLAKRVLSLEPFVLGIAGLSLLQPDGLNVFLAMLVKSTLCLFTMVLVTSTTRFSDLLGVLRRLRAPGLLVTTLALMDRYLSLSVEELGRMRRARKSRTFSKGAGLSWRTSAALVAHLFVRASERAERVYLAMLARGWKT